VVAAGVDADAADAVVVVAAKAATAMGVRWLAVRWAEAPRAAVGRKTLSPLRPHRCRRATGLTIPKTALRERTNSRVSTRTRAIRTRAVQRRATLSTAMGLPSSASRGSPSRLVSCNSLTSHNRSARRNRRFDLPSRNTGHLSMSLSSGRLPRLRRSMRADRSPRIPTTHTRSTQNRRRHDPLRVLSRQLRLQLLRLQLLRLQPLRLQPVVANKAAGR
jgi:hypothetical protein